MQPVSPLNTTKEDKKVENFKRKAGGLNKEERNTISMGSFYNEFTPFQKIRFNHLIKSICKKHGISARKSPLPMILVKRIAVNTILLEDYEAKIIREKTVKTLDEDEKWRFQASKDLRESMETLMALTKTTEKKQSLGSFADMRGALREKEGLDPSEADETAPDGHDRRHYDDITRTVPK